MSEKNVNKQIAKGAIWMVGLRFSIKFISIISTIILVRVLEPEDFGIVAIAGSIYAFIELVRAFGLGVVLIQKQDAEPVHYHTAWTLQILFALFSCSIIVTLAWPMAELYDDPRLSSVLLFMAFLTFISGFDNIGVIEFQKQMTFHKEFLFGILKKLIGFLTTIPLAIILESYWALLLGMLAMTFTSFVLSYRMQNFRPRLTLKAWRDLMSFSSWLFIFNVLNFFQKHGQNLILGMIGGSGSVGLLSIANEIATVASTEIVAPINRAAFPGYSKLSNDMSRLKNSYLKTLGYIVLISVPSAVGLAVTAPLFVPIVLGMKWLESIPVIQIIAISSIFVAVNTNSSYIFMALARQKLNVLIMLLRILLLLPLIYFLAQEYGVPGVAYAMLITGVIMFPIIQLVVKKAIDFSLSELLCIFYRPVLASVLMAVIVNLYTRSVTFELGGMNNIIYLIVSIILGAVSFSVTMVLLWLRAKKPESAEQFLISRLMKRLKR